MQPAAIILPYANPRGGQPLGSMFTVEWFDDGVDLTQPNPANWTVVAVHRLVALFAAVAAVLFVVADFRGRAHTGGGMLLSFVALIPAAMAVVVWTHACRCARADPFRITLRGGRLSVRNDKVSILRAHWTLRRPRRFAVGGLGNSCNVMIVHYGFHRSCQVCGSMSRDECVWIAGLLNSALTMGCDDAAHGARV